MKKNYFLKYVLILIISITTSTLFGQTTFNFTGSIQTFTVPASGDYQLEVWGAQGGNVISNEGGKGGYAVGEKYLTAGTVLYIYVGGQGLSSTGTAWEIINGGYNGGGGIRRYTNLAASGGGASDISTVGGECTLDGFFRYSRTAASYNGRIIVAGGGGGYSSAGGGTTAGHGGGLNGDGAADRSTGIVRSTLTNVLTGGYGTQTSGGNAELYPTPDFATYAANSAPGSFGLGGTYYSANQSNTAAGGGGAGYYGGGVNCHGNGGGGSSYIAGLTNASTTTGVNIGMGSVVITALCSGPDTDGDSIPDMCDNCPAFSNIAQTDTDSDGLGDVCDLDDDNDGLLDVSDPNPLVATVVADSGNASEGTLRTYNILANDDFAPGANTTITRTGGTATGIVSFNALTGEMSYTAAVGEEGTTVTLGYQVCNTAVIPNVCANATVTITVLLDTDGDGDPDIADPDDDNDGNPDGSDPNPLVATAVNDLMIVIEDVSTTYNIIANDDYLNNLDPTSTGIISITQIGGTATGTASFDVATGELTYVSAPGEEGTTITLSYQVCNTAVIPNVCANATVTITVLLDTDGDGNPDITDPNPFAATATGDSMNVTEGVANTVNVLANDDYLLSSSLSLTNLGTGSASGIIALDPLTGILTYTPALGEAGTTVTVDYQVCHIAVTPNVCSSASVIITVQADTDNDGIPDITDTDDDNDGNPDTTDPNPLVATSVADSMNASEGMATTQNIIGNDDFLTTSTLAITNLGSGTAGGTITFNATTGEITYTPAAGEEGTLVTVDYQVCNTDVTPNVCATATVIIVVIDEGNPIAVNDLISTLENTLVTTSNVLTNDSVVDGATITSSDVTSTNGGSVSNNGDGTFDYTPVAGFSGTDTFTYTLCDNDLPVASCSTATVTITVIDNGSVVAVDDFLAITEGTTTSTPINAIGNDNTIDGATYSAGSLNVTGTTGAVTDNGNGTFGYIPAVGFSGTDTFTYTICDNDATPTCDTATVTITVTDEGNPIAVNDAVSLLEGTTISTPINAIGNDNTQDNATYLVGSLDVTGTTGAVTDNGNGTFGYIPAAGFSGTDTFTYTICDNDATPTCDTATVTITVIDNGSVVAVDDFLAITEGTTTSTPINAIGNDNTIDGATYSAGSLNVTGTTGAVTDNGNGTFGYIPAVGFSGTDTFTYTICDNDAIPTCDTATVFITVTDTGNPIAIDDNISITEDTTIATVISALNNDSLIDGATYSIGSFIYTGANGATIIDNNNGTFDYTPAPGFSGLDSFSYTICDNDLPVASCSTATVFVTVLDEGNPFAVNDTATTILNTAVITGNVLINDTVIDNATITSFDTTSANGGIVADNGGGTYLYTPPVGFIGIDTFTYTICDDDTLTPSCSTATVTITVLAGSSDLVTGKIVSIPLSGIDYVEGETIVYTVFVDNNGPNDATNVSLTDLLPIGVTYVSDDAAGAYNSGSGIWTIGSIANGAAVFLNITATVNVGTGGQTITNFTTAATGDQSDPGPGVDDLSEPITVSNETDIVLTKVVSNSSPNVGDTVTYIVTVTNNGGAAVTNLVVTDALPAGLTYGLVIPTVGTWTSPNWTVGSLASGVTETIFIEAVVGAGTGGQVLTNTVTNTQDQTDDNTTPDDPSEIITVTSTDLVTTKTVDNSTPDEGDTIVYTVTVTNNGPSDATGVNLTDLLPAGVTYVSDDAAGAYNPGSGLWTVGGSAINPIVNGSFETGDYTGWTIVNDGSGIFTVGSTTPTDGVFISNLNQSGPGSHRLYQDIVIPSNNPILELDFGYDNFGGVFDANQYFSIVVRNATNDAILTTLFQTLSGDVNNSSIQGYSFDLSAFAGQLVRLDIIRVSTYIAPLQISLDNVRINSVANTLVSGDSVTLNITATVDAGTSNTTITNFTTAATGDQSDPTTVGDDLLESIAVANDADIVLTKVVDNNSPNEGDTITYTVTVTNNGPAAVTNLVVADALDAGLTFGLVTPSIGTWASPNWTIGSLTPGATETITIEAIVGVGTGGTTLVNTVSNTQDQTDDNTTPDDASESVTVTSSDLVTTKVVDNSAPVEGATIVYTIEVTNTGSTATGVSLTDNLPAGVTYVSDDSAGAYNSGSGIWTIGAIANGATATLNITATVNAGTSGDTITNFTTAATGDQSDPTTVGDDLSESITVSNNADIVLTKVVDNNSPNEGDTVTYTVTVTNNGAAAVTNLVVADALPAGLTFGLATPSAGVWTAPNWTIGSLTPGATETITIEAIVGVGTGGTTLVNTVSNTQDQTDDNATPDDASESVTVTSSDLVTTKTVSNNTPSEGDIIIYTLEVTNNGPSAATGVSLVDNLPIGVSYVSHSTLSGAFNSGSGIWTIGAIANGATVTLEISAVVNIGTGGTIITNFTTAATGDQSDPTTVGDDLSESITVSNNADIVLTKVVDNNSPNEGDTVTYTVTVTNNGAAAVTNLVVADALPAGLTFGLATPSAGVWTAPNWTIGSLTPGATETITIEAIVGVGTGGTTLVNTVSNTQDQTDDNTTPDDASESVTVTSSDLVTTKVVDNSAPVEGATIVYTIEVTNTGSTATGVSLIDNLPAGVTYVSDDSAGAYNSGSGIWTIGSIADGTTAILNITATVNAGTSDTTITNFTTAATGDQSDPTTVGDDLSESITVSNNADIVLTKVVDNNSPNEGDTVTYTVTVTNNGAAAVTNLVVADALPAGLTFGLATPSAGVWTAPNWTIGSLTPGATETITIEAIVGVGTGGTTLVNTVSNTQDQTDDNTTPDDASESVTVTSSDLETLKTVSDASPNEGNIITYTIEVTNNGPSNATSVSLIDNLPVGVTYVSHSTMGGVFNNGSGEWFIGNLADGDTATLTIDASVDAGTVGVTITNTTSAVIADQSDPNISNNIGSVSIVPVAFIDLSLTKTIVNNITAPLVGDQITFEIRVNNEGPTDASGVQVTDLIPSGYEFVNYSSTIGGYDPITGIWHIGNVEIGNMAVLLVDVIVLESGDYTNCAEITAANEDDVDSTPNSGNDGEDDYACALTVPVNEADLSITKTVVANNVTPLVDTEVTFEIRISNNGPLDATEVEVTDMLPDGYTFVNYSSTIGTYSEVSGLWTIGTILEGETEVLLIDVIVNATGDYENCTTITNLRQIDPNPSNDSDCASTTPIPVADLELTKDVDNLLPYAETNIDFTIVVTNNGPSEATGVVVTDLLPSGYTFVSYSATAGTYDAGSGLWNVGNVINGETETLTVTAYVLPIGDWTNVAEVTAANELDLDSTPGNNDIYEDDQAQVTTAPIILLTMPEGFSPDGDGMNDTFEIEYLGILYPNFSMQIVNRYGNKVYEYQHNGNPNTTPLWWDGFSNGRWNLDSLELPTGTYFYTIYFNNDERKPQTGWIYLRR